MQEMNSQNGKTSNNIIQYFTNVLMFENTVKNVDMQTLNFLF